MNRLLVAGTLAAAALFAAAPAAHAGATTCTGLMTSSVAGDVVVPAGATCTLDERPEISGNVTLKAGARLDGAGTIRGSLRIGRDASVFLMDSLIGGDVVCRACRRLGMHFMYGVGGDVRVTGMNDGYLSWDGVHVGGNIRVTRNSGEFTFIDTGADGKFTFSDNTVESAGFWYSGAVGPVTIVRNSAATGADGGAFSVFHLEGNTSGSNLVFSNNTGSSTLLYNHAARRFRCQGNDPAPVGLGNSAGGGLQGQCAGLVGDGD